MTLREFGEKYQGNLQSALRGYQKERLAAAGIDGSTDEIDRSERKRKWVASHEVDSDVSGNKEADHERSLKTGQSFIIYLSTNLHTVFSSNTTTFAQEASFCRKWHHATITVTRSPENSKCSTCPPLPMLQRA
jgi:hypothetical protein